MSQNNLHRKPQKTMQKVKNYFIQEEAAHRISQYEKANRMMSSPSEFIRAQGENLKAVLDLIK